MSTDDLTRLFASAPFDTLDARTVVATARALGQSAAGKDGAAQPLRGKNVALICACADSACAREFDAAASALGARVARIEPEADWLQGKLADASETARLLGRLYDAIDCEEVPEGFARALRQAVGVPVFDGLGRSDHALAGLLPQLRNDARGADAADQRHLVQAVLMHALSRAT